MAEVPTGLPGLPEPLPCPVVDNHTHLGYTREHSGLGVETSLDLASQVGVTRVVDVGCDVASSREAVSWAQQDPRVVAAVALHPNDAAALWQRGGEEAVEEAFQVIRQLASEPGVRAIGETGLDHYRTRDAEAQAAQERWFRRHIALARELDLTLVIHDRDAHDDVLRVLDEEGAPSRVVMHCFSGDAALAAQCAGRGYWLSFPGVVTFGSADSLREAAAATSLERMLVETDAPYLTPKPERGKPNAPYLLPHTVRFLADLKGVPVADFCQQVSRNTDAAYGGSWGEDA